MIKLPPIARWLPECAAALAAVLIAHSTGMTWWQGAVLWVLLDLMTIPSHSYRRRGRG